jgi:4-carboxymuconolactone decarboxylase
MSLEKRWDKGLDILHQVVGSSAGHVQDSLAEVAPDLGRFLAEYFGDMYSRPGLDLKSREIATVAALTVLGTLPQLKVHVGAALNVGCRQEEIIELMMQMVLYAGFPAALNGVAVAQEVFAELSK